jgi:BMFP domain-containing protein YqiC
MNEELTAEGYEQTQEKLRKLQQRLAEIEARTDLAPARRATVARSYHAIMRQYLREIKLYESRHSISTN